MVLPDARQVQDLIMDVVTEEMGHVEMIATMVARSCSPILYLARVRIPPW